MVSVSVRFLRTFALTPGQGSKAHIVYMDQAVMWAAYNYDNLWLSWHLKGGSNNPGLVI